MSVKLDVRGMTPPNPLIVVLKKLNEQNGDSLEVLADSQEVVDTIRETVSMKGWRLGDVFKESDGLRFTLAKG